MDIFCITIFIKFDGRGRFTQHPTDRRFYYSSDDWELAASRIEWALDFPKPYLSNDRANFDKFVDDCIKHNHTLIIPDYFTGKHSDGRLIIEKNVYYGQIEKETHQGAKPK